MKGNWLLVTGLFMLMTASTVLADQKFDKTAVSPFETYCDGYGMPGAQGLGYVSVLKVSTGTVEKSDDLLIDGIIAYDRAEANDAYIGQINMLTASSFNGVMGSIWGYDLAKAEIVRTGKQKPMFTLTQYDGTPLPVYDAAPLIEAGQALFGTEKERHFPPAPGSHVICAQKEATAYRPQKGKPKVDKGQAYGVWCFLCISLAKDRNTGASLFIEDAGVWTKNDNEQEIQSFLSKHQRNVANSIIACGKDQSVIYDRTYMSYAYVIMSPGQVGTALTVSPYVTLARKALPAGGFSALEKISLNEWEKEMGFKTTNPK
ncbi:histidine decarboxylase, pyruvoyl type [Maridesulfovibrio sp.]|uniref:histidine decarboxylase, pyruvoyl type n=1 Tax=Maridesulfovibrio sp. TaxID=2795000 RepID=UPI0029F503AC|nr:histidine decarboxylase, pyruvoyl type [Maridesulfovibrio sp.]